MKSGIIKGNFLSRSQLKELPDRTLYLLNDKELKDVTFVTADPNGKAKVGSLMYNTSNETLWVSTPTGWKQLKLGGGGGDLDPTTWQGIRNIVRAGKAQEFFSIGDEINIAKYTSPKDNITYDLPFIVADFKNATLENGQSVPAMMLWSKYTLDIRMPLSPTGDVDGTTYTQGYSRWDWDMQHQWLNGSGSGWFVNHLENSSDVSQYTGYTGFLSCISSDLAEVLTPTRVNTLIGDYTQTVTTYDKFFTFSNEQYFIWSYGVYGDQPETIEETEAKWGLEGGSVEYLKRAWLATGATKARYSGADELVAQCAPTINDTTYASPSCWMRSASGSFTNHRTTGSWGTTYANTTPKTANYMRPATIIC